MALQLPCSCQTKAGTSCGAYALKGTNPPACINHDPRPATRSLKRAAVKKGGQRVWAKQQARVQETVSRADRMHHLQEALNQNPNLSMEQRTLLQAAVDDVVRASRVSDSTKALNLLGLLVGALGTRQMLEDQGISDEELVARLHGALKATGAFFICDICGQHTTLRTTDKTSEGSLNERERPLHPPA